MVVSDTSPLNYLVLAGYIDLLPRVDSEIVVPQAVARELTNFAAPPLVRRWMQNPPGWLDIVRCEAPLLEAPRELHLGQGEAEAITLALRRKAILLADDGAARRFASSQGIPVVGTFDILGRLASKGLLDLPVALNRLQATTFYISTSELERFLSDYKQMP
jgi:predicted nucleic acid-binding protein